MSHILQCVWPITDDTYTRSQLIAEATPQLEDLADQTHAVITGPPLWTVHNAADVPGWTGYAPGLVLVAIAPAEPYGSLAQHRIADPNPDPVVVQRLVDGDPPATARPIERTAAMATMARTAVDFATVASRFGVGIRAVEQAVHRDAKRRELVAA